MREGYKMTELGEIPEDWIVTTLKESGEILSGGTPDTKNLEYWNGAISWCTPTDITSLGGSKFIADTNRSISQLGLQNSSATIIPPYSLIVCTRATIGYCAININQITTNQGFKSIIPNSKWEVNFIYYLVNYLRGAILKLSSGSTFLEISKKAFENLVIPFPPLAEQQKIAQILSAVDEKIEVIDAQISQTRELKKGLMQKLLTRGIGHTKFKDSVLGEIPESWEVVKLGRLVFKVGSGITPKGGHESYVASGVTFIRSQNVLVNKLNLTDVAYISSVQHDKMNNSKVQPNDVLLNITGASIGRSCVVPDYLEEANVNQHVCIIRTNGELNSLFLTQLLNSELGSKQIDKFQAGGNREGLNFQQIKSFDIPLPSPLEQKRIVDLLSTVDGKVDILDEKKETYQQFKKGLMQQLLTGKVRVVEKETLKEETYEV